SRQQIPIFIVGTSFVAIIALILSFVSNVIANPALHGIPLPRIPSTADWRHAGIGLLLFIPVAFAGIFICINYLISYEKRDRLNVPGLDARYLDAIRFVRSSLTQQLFGRTISAARISAFGAFRILTFLLTLGFVLTAAWFAWFLVLALCVKYFGVSY